MGATYGWYWTLNSSETKIMSSTRKPVAFERVLRHELRDIDRRRKVIDPSLTPVEPPKNEHQDAEVPKAEQEVDRSGAKQSKAQRLKAEKLRAEHLKAESDAKLEQEMQRARSRNLVGVALSGGGVRSGAVSLGFLQAFYNRRILNQLDYLSTVSGGGYAGTYLTAKLSKLAQSNQKVNWTPVPADWRRGKDTGTCKLDLSLGKGRQQSKEMRRLIYGGMYLGKFRELISTTFIGIVVNWLMILASLTALVTVVAILYRLFDVPAIEEIPEIGRVTSSSLPAFGDIWEALTYAGDIPKAFVPTVIIGSIWLPMLVWRLFSKKRRWQPHFVHVQSWLSIALIGSLLCAAVMILNTAQVNLAPSETSATRVDYDAVRQVQKWSWLVLVSAVLISLIPFLRRNDLAKSGTTSSPQWKGWVARFAVIGMLVGVPLMIFGIVVKENLFNYNASRPDRFEITRSHVKDWESLAHQLQQSAAVSHGSVNPAQNLADRKVDGEVLTVGAMLEKIIELENVRRAVPRDYWLVERWVRSVDLDGGPVADLYAARRDARNYERKVALAISMALSDPQFFKRCPPASGCLPAHLKGREVEYGAVLGKAAALAELHGKNPSSSQQPTKTEIQKTNRALFDMQFPGQLFSADTAFAHHVWTRDQWHRLGILLWAGAISLALGLGLDVNHTSAHHYYRQRLSEMWIPEFSDGTQMNLTEMANTDCGGPLHLINATVHLNGPRRLPDHEPTEMFLFSRRFCGSNRCDYERSNRYANRAGVSVADAMAISGAAVTPYAVRDNLLLFYAFILTNARLGQWVRNPGEDVFLKHPAFLPAIFKHFFGDPEKNPYLYLSDGGQHDNTGIESLLRRRCRIIIALDASWDPQDQFLDLLRLFRRMTMFEGIRFNSADGPVELTKIVRDPDLKLSEEHFTLIRITYPEDKNPAWLIYVKSSLTGDEKPEVLRYREDNQVFPHDPTTDQFFDPRRFECYRELGYHLGTVISKELTKTLKNPVNAEIAKSVLWLKDADFSPIADAQRSDSPPELKQLLAQLSRSGNVPKSVIRMLHNIIDTMPRARDTAAHKRDDGDIGDTDAVAPPLSPAG